MTTAEVNRTMRNRLSMEIVIVAIAIISLGFWLGCEQKGTIAPNSTGQGELLYLETVRVSQGTLAPGAQCKIEAHVLSESGRDAVGEAIRFSANRGTFLDADFDTTVSTDENGWASATYVAPEDTGAVTLRAELISMSELVTHEVYVTSTGQPAEGQLYLWADTDTLFADNGQSSTSIHFVSNATYFSYRTKSI